MPLPFADFSRPEKTSTPLRPLRSNAEIARLWNATFSVEDEGDDGGAGSQFAEAVRQCLDAGQMCEDRMADISKLLEDDHGVIAFFCAVEDLASEGRSQGRELQMFLIPVAGDIIEMQSAFEGEALQRIAAAMRRHDFCRSGSKIALLDRVFAFGEHASLGVQELSRVRTVFDRALEAAESDIKLDRTSAAEIAAIAAPNASVPAPGHLTLGVRFLIGCRSYDAETGSDMLDPHDGDALEALYAWGHAPSPEEMQHYSDRHLARFDKAVNGWHEEMQGPEGFEHLLIEDPANWSAGIDRLALSFVSQQISIAWTVEHADADLALDHIEILAGDEGLDLRVISGGQLLTRILLPIDLLRQRVHQVIERLSANYPVRLLDTADQVTGSRKFI
ncbi:hypothetical protein ACEUZ9_005486 [Paracoccus litorisediminis]|uniref:hypothetical protein n=1 Tax=Paracoccus litorisediminis TaxID=2006130 RepID=UPI00372FEBC0